jgi:mono/diheme cytochrome c family protein
MRKVLKWIGIVVGSLLGLLAILVIGLLIYGQMSFKPTHRDYPLYPIIADTSPEGQARGKYLMEAVMSCDKACHSEGSAPFIGAIENVNEGPISAVFAVPNLTPDQETGMGSWTDAEIARAIREGVDRDGVELVIMPSQYYRSLSDADVAAVVGYLRSLEPVRNEIPPLQVNAIGKAMSALGMLGPKPKIEAITAPQVAPAKGTAEYGNYLISIADCRSCHAANLAGVIEPGPGFSPSPNLTPGGELIAWNEADFIKAMRMGVKPNGNLISEDMPWKAYARMTDEDLASIWLYLQSLPPTQPER